MTLPDWMKSGLGYVVLIGYQVGALATFGKLTFLDDYPYTWWNWIVVVPINAFLSQIWPLYWGLIRPIFGSQAMRFLRVAGMVLMIVWMITGGLRALGALFAGDFVWAVLGIAQIGVALLLYDRLRTWTPREANPDLE